MLETVESVAQGEGEHSDQAAAARARQLLSTPPGDTDRAPGAPPGPALALGSPTAGTELGETSHLGSRERQHQTIISGSEQQHALPRYYLECS